MEKFQLHWPARRWWWLLAGLAIVIFGIVVYIVVIRGPNELRESRQDFETTTKAISKLYEFPNEVPVLATVTDKEKLAEQPFFDLAENGDKVLVFNTARKVILYRPSSKKIINFSNLNPSELNVQGQLPEQTTTSVPATPTADVNNDLGESPETNSTLSD